MSLKISWLSNFIAPAISYNGTLLKIVRVSPRLTCQSPVENLTEDNIKSANYQTPALFLNSCYKLGA